MKSFIFCTSYINNFSRKHLSMRYKRWINFYQSRMVNLNAEYLFLIDDGSKKRNFDKRADILNPDHLPDELNNKTNIVHFHENLGRQSIKDYPGWWRSFLYSYKIAQKYDFDKIIHIESDFFVLSDDLINYVSSIQSGWTTLFSQHFQLPETALQIICKDFFDEMKNFVDQADKSNFHFPDLAENMLPFTHIEKKFIGERVGEAQVYRAWKKKHKKPVKVDYLAQIKPYLSLNNYRSKFIF